MSESKVPPGRSRTNTLPPAPLISTLVPPTPTAPGSRRSTDSTSVPPSPTSRTSALRLSQADTPKAARASEASRKALEDLHGRLDAFLDKLCSLSGKVVSRQDTFALQELLQAMPAEAHQAAHAEALDFVRERISRHDAPDLVELLVTLMAHSRQDKQYGDPLLAIEQCVRQGLLSRARESAATELAALAALASGSADAAAATQLRVRLSGLPDASLLAASRDADPQLAAAAQECVQGLHAGSVRNLEAAYARVVGARAAGVPADMAQLSSLLQDSLRAVLDHERVCALHGLAPGKQAQGIRAFLDNWLRRPLERLEVPLHLAAPAERQAICAALALLEPMAAPRPEDHFQATYLTKCLSYLEQGHLPDALLGIRAAQEARTRAANGQPEGLQAGFLKDLFTRLPREQLIAWAKALDGEPVRHLMAAMGELAGTQFAGLPLGRDIAACHQDLQDIRQALGVVLGERIPKQDIKPGKAMRNLTVQSALRKAFPLQVDNSSPEVEFFATTGPVRARAQAVFDEALEADLNPPQGMGGKGDVEINGVRIAPGFLQAARRIPCLVSSAAGQRMEPVEVAGKSDASLVRQFMERTGATAAQMTALSRIYDADARIDSAMLSPGSVLQFAGDITVLPSLSPEGRRASQVKIRPDADGNLMLRFTTELTGIASVLPISGRQFLQPRAVALRNGSASFRHDMVIARNGSCSKVRLNRSCDLPPQVDNRPRRKELPVLPRDLVAHPDSLRALGQMVDRRLGTGFTEYLDNVEALLGIPKDQVTNALMTAQGIQLAFLADDRRFKALGLDVDARSRVMSAMEQASTSSAPAAMNRVAEAFRATRDEVAQVILDHAKALLATHSAVKP